MLHNTSTTQGSAPLALQMDQRRDRQPPTLMAEGHGFYFQKDDFFGVGDRSPLMSKDTLDLLTRDEE